MEQSVDDAVKRLVLKNADDEVLAHESHRWLEPERQQILASAFSECEPPKKVLAVVATEAGGAKKEFTAVFREGSAEELQLVTGSCQITYEDLCPSECVEYCFADGPGTWAMAQLSLHALETYRGMKFEAWRKMLLEPTCEAQFRRMLQIGMVSQLYDPHVFPTPESMKPTYQVTDERTGKLIELPHPVSALRIWDAHLLTYTPIDTQLKGAPPESEKEKWWANFIKELEDKHGHDYIAGLMGGK